MEVQLAPAAWLSARILVIVDSNVDPSQRTRENYGMKRLWMPLLLLVLLLAASFVWFLVSPLFHNLYPLAPLMPPAPKESLADILRNLDTRIEQHSPKTFAALQPGLSRDEIQKLETEYGLSMTDELRQLYEWHDGISLDSDRDLFGIHRFYPLKRLAEAHQLRKQTTAKQTGLVGLIDWAVCRHRRDWIELFPDDCGDGYYVDPTRRPVQGAIFYNFTETGRYRFYHRWPA